MRNTQLILGILSSVLLILLFYSGHATSTEFISKGAIWKYLDDGSNQATAWQTTEFDDGIWKSGPARLGYGNDGEVTQVLFGGSSSNKYITTYFRSQFNVINPAQYQYILLELLRDDGAVVYLNGTEVLRDNMPSGSIDFQTTASSTIGGSSEDLYTQHFLAASALVEGVNTLAVEIHQRSSSSSDISLDLALTGSTIGETINVIRGPYLQMGSSDAMTVRWRTNLPSDGRVQFGNSVDNLSSIVNSAVIGTDHEIRITGLEPQTQYYYSVGNSTDTFLNGANFQFETSPVIGSQAPLRIWVIGDSGTANSNAQAVYNAYRTETDSTYTDLWLMLGDNAYNSGTDSEYQQAVFDLYPELLRQTPLWPTLGNHDGYSADSASESGPYYDIFTLPRQAEVGGIASGTEAYYSFDHGNVHFIVLDSYHTIQTTSASEMMMQWLEMDLQNTTADWTIAYWHHPPYSKGSHDSDGDSRMRKMRTIALPILEDYGVDLVLGGHSHAYERSKFIDSHYGVHSDFNASNEINAGSGRIDDDGAYRKQAPGSSSHAGTVYAVAGSSGKISSSGNLDHNAMFLSLRELGSMILEIDGLTLNASFLNSSGVKNDYFTLTKGTDTDGDGVTDDADNCPTQSNPRQSDTDGDGNGDLCTPYLLTNETWHQISMPADLGDQNTAFDIFGDDLPKAGYGHTWVIFGFNPTSNQYYQVNLTDSLKQGEGYWITQLTGADINIDLPTSTRETSGQVSDQCASPTGCFEVPVATRTGVIQWSMIGHPFEFSADMNRVRVITNAGTCNASDGCNLDEAEAAGVLHNRLFSYNGTSYDSLGIASSINSWAGSWAATLTTADGLEPKMLIPLP